jgi:hypothetical protein
MWCGGGTRRPWRDLRVEEKAAAGGSSRMKLGAAEARRSRGGWCGAEVRKKKGEGILVQEGIAAVYVYLRMAF